MYGYITPGHQVGQLFEQKPPTGRYHPDFLAALAALPAEVTTGWRLEEGAFLPPDASEEGSDAFSELRRAVEELVGPGQPAEEG